MPLVAADRGRRRPGFERLTSAPQPAAGAAHDRRDEPRAAVARLWGKRVRLFVEPAAATRFVLARKLIKLLAHVPLLVQQVLPPFPGRSPYPLAGNTASMH